MDITENKLAYRRLKGACGPLEKLEAFLTVGDATENVSALTRLFAATLGSPVIKIAAFSYGVRQVLTDRRDRGDRRLRGRR